MKTTHTYIRSHVAIFVLFFAVLFGVYGCNKMSSLSNLGSQDITIKVDWAGTALSGSDSKATVYIYQPGKSSPTILTDVDHHGKTVKLSGGSNKIVMHNSSLNQLFVDGFSQYESSVASLNELPNVSLPSGDGQAEQPDLPSNFVPSLQEPLMLVSANSQILVSGDSAATFTLKPQNVTSSYKFTINTPTTYSVKSLTATLSGVASAMQMSTVKTVAENPSNALLELTSEKSSNALIYSEGVFNALGLVPSDKSEGAYVLSMYIETEFPVDGYKNNIQKDLTTFFNEFKGQNLIISLTAISPDPVIGGSIDFDVKVEPWIQVDGGSVEIEPQD